MPANGESLADRVQASYLQLSAVATDLNTISDELGKCIAEIDAALKKLNLGITVWVQVHGWDDNMEFYREQIGYAKVDGKWGICLRTVRGNDGDPENTAEESWLFNDAPRKLRLAAIEKIPEMLTNLSKEAVSTTNNIKSKLAEAQEVAAAVRTAAAGPKPARRIVGSGSIFMSPAKDAPITSGGEQKK